MSSTTGRVAAGRRPRAVRTADRNFLTGGGEMGELMRRHDWSSTPLGSPSQWPQSLRTATSIMLCSRYPMFVWWGRDLINLYNDAYRPLLGAKHPHALGQPAGQVWSEIWDLIGPRTRVVLERAESTFDEALLLIMERFGYPEETYFTFSYSPIRGEDGGVAGLFCAVSDETRWVIGERRLRLLREVASASETHSPEQVCTAVADCITRSARDLPFAVLYLTEHGGTSARLVAQTNMPAGMPDLGSLCPLDTAEAVWPLRQVFLEGDQVIVEHLRDRLALLPTGAWDRPPERAVVVPLREQAQGAVAGFLIAGLNPYLSFDEDYRGFVGLLAEQIGAAIARARAYQEERRRAEALAEIDLAKTAFFSDVSHEFRTPLNLMLGPLDEASAHPGTPEAVRSQVDLARHNALRLLKLVNTLLDFARIEAGRVQAAYEPTDLSALTRDLASAFRSAMQRVGLVLVVECEELGEPVYVDREMWEKIVLNLLSNALKFTLEGKVSVGLRRRGERAALEVADTGVGVPAQELPRLFERFHRVAGTAGRTQEGSGIGLALVHELVKLHGGTIEVASEVGTGTTFQVLIPLGAAHLPGERIQAPRSQASTAVGAQGFVQKALRWTAETIENPPSVRALGGRPRPPLDPRFLRTAGARILLADDNADMRGYVRDLLSQAYAVEAVADGEAALAAARRQRPDLILADIMMPRLEGLGLLKVVRDEAALREIPVILLSARAGEEARLEGLDAGADDYLVKPFAARELLARVGALLELTRMRRESKQRFRAFVSATSEIIYRMSPDWSELRHLDGRNVIPDSADPSRAWLERYVHPEDQPRLMTAIRDAIRSKSVLQLEHRVRRLDGTWGWMFSRAIPLLDAEGNITEWFGAGSDVTERRRNEHARGWLASIIESSHDAIVSKTLDGIITSWNPAAVQLFGYEPAEIIGKPITSIIPPELRAEEAEFLARLRRGERIEHHETVRTTKDGRAIEVALTISPIKDDRGVIIGASKIARDIAVQKRAERALREADRRKDEFLALLGHELRNPLSPISTASELLARTLAHDAPAQISINMIKRQAAHLTRLVDDLLDIGRITQGRIHLKLCSLELASVIAQAIETVEPLFREKQHQVSIVSSYQPLYVHGDFARLVQCVVNILTNAAKYTEPEGQIRIVTRVEGARAVIEISDTGAGIAPDLLPRVFDLFVQSDRTLDRAQGGLGIGLSVVKRLIEMHAGEVTAQSGGIGQGSTFEIRLPRIARPEAAARPDSPRSPARRVLIVDDNVDAANSLAMLLRHAGHETQVAYSGREALTRIESFEPEVALLDIGLPEMDGYELASRLRAVPQLGGTRLVALTGYGQSEDRKRSQEAGFDDHLVKPVDLPALERTLAGMAAPASGARG